MFLISVFVPSAVEPTGRIDTLASQRSEPSSILTSLTPSCQERAAQRFEIADGFFRTVDLGFGDAFHQRNAGTVEVDERIRAARDAAVAGSRVRRLSGVFFQMDARETAFFHRAVLEPVAHRTALRERHVVLRDLVIFRHVRIEVVLPVEFRKRGNFRVKGQTRADHVLDRDAVCNRQRTRKRKANRADLRVRLAAELVRAAAEHLRCGL